MAVNITCCSEPCRYQREGLCTLPPNACLGQKTGGCCYFEPLGYEGVREYALFEKSLAKTFNR